MYQDLLEMERKLDWTMMRKKVEIEDALTRVQPVRQLNPLSFLNGVFIISIRVGATDAQDIPQPHGFWPSVATAGNRRPYPQLRHRSRYPCMATED